MTRIIKLLFVCCIYIYSNTLFSQVVPTITSFSPISGVPGTTVVITGTTFAVTPTNNHFYFGAAKATVSASTTTSCTVTVPSGASYGPISITKPAADYTSYSTAFFNPTQNCPDAIGQTSFDTSSIASFSTVPYYVTYGDMDLDGKPDMIVAEKPASTISYVTIYRNTSVASGAITFATGVTYAVGSNIRNVTVGDLNQDGKLDIACLNRTDGTVSVLINTSTAAGVVNFNSPVSYLVSSGGGGSGIAIGDLNKDGKPDIAVATGNATNTDSIAVLQNLNVSSGAAFTSGSFAPYVSYFSGNTIEGLAMGDIDGDSFPDIVSSNTGNNNLSVFRNTSTAGGTISFAARVTAAAGTNPFNISIGDINADGKLDITVGNNNLSGSISVIQNNSVPGTISLASQVAFLVGANTNARDADIVDVNGDGKLDFISAGGNNDQVKVFLNSAGSGTINSGFFTAADTFFLPLAYAPRDVAAIDLNADGKTDFVTVSQVNDKITIFRSLVNGGPYMTSVSSATSCSGSSVGLAFTATPSPTTYSWNTSATGSVTGESTGAQTASSLTNTLTISSGITPVSLTYTVTPSSTTCPGGTPHPQTVTVTVNQKPIINAMTTTVCSGIAFSSTPFNTTNGTVPAGTTYSWSAPTVTGGMTGGVSGTNAASITGTLTNTTTTAQTATYVVTPSASSCSGSTFTLTVTVNPKPVMTSATSTSVCSGTALNFALTSGVASTYSWLTSAKANVTGETTTSTVGSTVNNTLVSSLTTATTLVYTITPTSTTGNCVGTAQTLTVTVNPLPVMTSATSTSVCSDAALNFALTSGAAASYSWLTTNNANTTGESTTSQIFSSINNTLASTALTATTLIYTVTPTGTAGSCVGAAQTVTVTVNPKPIMTSATSTSVCSGTALSFPFTTDAASTFSWKTLSNVNVTGESTIAQTGAILNNTLSSSLTTPTPVVYTVTPTGTAGSCVGTAQNVTVTVNPKPVMSSANSTSVCSETPLNFALTSATSSTFTWISNSNGNVTGESTTLQSSNTISDLITNITDLPRALNYTVTPTGTAGSCVGNIQTVSVTINPKPIMTSATTYSVCSGVAMNFPLTSGATSTYSWLTSDNVNTTGESVLGQSGATLNNTVNHTLATAQALVYTVTPTGTAGACVGNAQNVTVTVNPKATMTSAITKTICSGSSVALALTSNLTSTYQWIAASNANVGGESTTTQTGTPINNVLTNTLTAAQTIIYTVTPTTSLGCVSNTQTVTITIDPQPTTAAAGPDQTACTSTALLNANQPTVGTGVWSQVSGPAASITNANLYNTTISALINSNTVVMQWTVSNGVCTSSTDQVSITYNTAAVQCLINSDFFADNSDPCINAPVIFTDNSLGASAYSWNFGPGATPPTANTAGPHNVTYSSAGAKNVSLFITGVNGSDTETKSAYINVVPTPSAAGAINGTFTLCAGTTQVLYSVSPISNATSYNWTLPSGATINTGAGTNSISVNFANNATSGNISVVGVNACGSGTSSSSSITVNPLPENPGIISGSTTVCQTLGSTSITYSINPIAGATTYNWTYPAGATPTITSNTLTLVFGTSAVSGDITVYGSNVSCGASLTTSTLSVVVNSLPGAAGSISGPATICQGATDNYSIDALTNATSYTWTLPSGGSTSSTSNSALVNFSITASSGNLTVAGTNTCGNGPSSSLSLTLDLLPFAPGSITGPATVCANSTGHVFSIAAIVNASSYNWVFPSGANSVNPNNIANTYFDANANSGLIEVNGVNTCGSGTVSTFSVTVSPLPDAAGVLTGSDTVCQGQTAVVYTINPVNNATNYVWFTPTGSTGTGTNSFSVDFSSSATSGNIKVYGNNACGNGDSTTIPVHVNPLPSPPVFTGSAMLAPCPLADSMLFNFSTALYAESFNWILPAGAYANGATNNDSINIGFNSVGINDTLKVASVNGCGSSAYSYMVLNLQALTTPYICMVSVDTLSDHNEIYWDKAGFNSSDTFLVYRDTANYNYALIGKVPYNSVSMFNDTLRTLYAADGNPNVSSWRYKIAVEDSCGNKSAMSPYHQTMFIQNTMGNFSWNHYQIEGETAPVPILNNYEITRDDFGTGAVNIIQSLSASSTAYTDVDYLTYQATADWRVFTNWATVCDPTLRINGNNEVQATIVKSKSNIKTNRIINPNAISEIGHELLKIKVYPNPTNSVINIELLMKSGEAVVTLENLLGQIVYASKTQENKHSVDVSGFENGVYMVKIKTNEGVSLTKIIIQK